jgi:hypothetical protein
MVPSRWGPSCHMIMPILPRTSGLLGRKDASIPAGVQSTSVISLHSRWNLHWFVRNLRIEPAELGADLSILLPGRDHLKLCQLWTTLPMLNALDPARLLGKLRTWKKTELPGFTSKTSGVRSFGNLVPNIWLWRNLTDWIRLDQAEDLKRKKQIRKSKILE